MALPSVPGTSCRWTEKRAQSDRMDTAADSVDHADFALLSSAGQLTYGRRNPGESVATAIQREILDPRTQELGRLRMWFSDVFTTELRDNCLADQVIGRWGYHHPLGLAGPVALTQVEDPRTGEIPPLTPVIRATLEELAHETKPSH